MVQTGPPPGGKAGRQLPAVCRALIGGQIIALFQGHGHRVVRVRIHEQVVLGQETCKEHAMPVLVGHLFDQPVHRLIFTAVEAVPQLTAMDAQFPAQVLFLVAEVRVGFWFADAELLDGRTRDNLCHVTRLRDGAFKFIS